MNRWCKIVVISLVAVMGCSSAVLAAKTISVFSRSSSATRVEFVKQVIALYEARHPDVKVELILSGTGGGLDYVEKLTVLKASGQMPDLWDSAADKAGYIMNGWVLDVTPYFERDKAQMNLNDFLPGTLDAFKRGGKMFGVPSTVCGQGIFYNADLFHRQGLALPPFDWNAAGWTWADFVNNLEKLSVVDSDGRLTQAGVTLLGEYKLPDLTWLFGGDWFTMDTYDTGIPQPSTLLRKENVEAYKAGQDLYVRKLVADGNGISSGSGFVQGMAAMDWIGWWKLASIKAAKPSFSWGWAPLPKQLTRNHTLWYDTMLISATTKYPEEAWEFQKLYASSEVQELMQKINPLVPTRRSALGAHVATITQNTTLKPAEVMQYIGSAVPHGRRSVEEVIYGGSDAALQMAKWIKPMIQGKEAVETALTRIKPMLDAMMAEKVEKLGK